MHAKHDSRELTANARRAFLSRFEDEVDPRRELPDAERVRRAEHARKAYFSRLALKSAKARRQRAEAAEAEAEAAIEAEADALDVEVQDQGHAARDAG